MGLRERVTAAQWCDFGEPITGRICLRPKTGRLQAQFQKKIGMVPKGLRREVTGTNPDGSDKTTDVVAFQIDPEHAYEARLWYLAQIIEAVEGAYESGTPWELNEEFFEALADDERAFQMVDDKAANLGEMHEAQVEGNSEN